jgi:hypothetical protein
MTPEPIKVTLTRSDMISAGTIGVMRRISSLGKLKDGMHSPHHNPWEMDCEGAMAELAYAKAFGVYWQAGIGTFRDPDVGNIQIRQTSVDNGCLIIRPSDKDDDIFVLVVGSAPDYLIAGWTRGKDGKDPRWAKAPNNGKTAYFIPQSALKPMTTK